MTATVPYLQLRRGTYYYVRRVPMEVTRRPLEFGHVFGGQMTVRWSLRTKNKKFALAQYGAFEARFEEMVERALPRSLPRLNSDKMPRRAVTHTFLKNVQAAQRESVLRRYRQTIIHAEQDPDTYGDELARMQDEFEADAERISNVLYGFGSSTDPAIDVPTIARELIEREWVNAPTGSNELSLVQNAIREGLREGFSKIRTIASGAESALPDISELPTRAPTISAAVSAHLLRQDRPRTIAEFKEALSAFTSLHGDLPLNEIRPSHFKAFCSEQARMEVGGRTVGSVRRQMSASTIQKKVRLLRSAIGSAIKTGQFDGPNPATDIDASMFAGRRSPMTMPEKRRFNDDELARIFAHPWFAGCESEQKIFSPGKHRLSGLHFWVPVVALLTGCRASELGGLMLNEIRLESAHPHIVVRSNAFRPTKSGKQREVPVLDQLLELGFAKWVEAARSNGHTRLFEEWPPPLASASGGMPAWSNGPVIRSFNSRVVPAALKDFLVPGARREVTFHSFRGAFKNMVGRPDYRLPPNYVNYVIGHSLPDLDQRYVGKIDLGDLFHAFHKCKFDPKLLPAPPSNS